MHVNFLLQHIWVAKFLDDSGGSSILGFRILKNLYLLRAGRPDSPLFPTKFGLSVQRNCGEATARVDTERENMSHTTSHTAAERGEHTTAAARIPATAAEAEAEETEHRRIILAAGGILLALALAVALLRLQRLSAYPQGIQSDEGPDGVYALQVLEGAHAVFFPEAASGREWMGVYTIALTTSFLGRTLLAFRLPTALASAGTVFAVFWLGRLLFGRDENGQVTPWRGLLIGGVGAGLLAVSLGQTIIGRASLRANFLPLLLALCFALLWWGWSTSGQQRSWWRIALAGVCAGLLPYTYIPSRFTPFLFLFFGLAFCGRCALAPKRGCVMNCRGQPSS